MIDLYSDEYFMREALKEANKAFEEDEVPVGAVLVSGNRIIARAHNQSERLMDVTAHAEMLAITSASDYLGAKFLEDCVMYVSLEPCLMCAGALRWSRISKIVYGADDPKNGCYKFVSHPFHPGTIIEKGLLAEESVELLSSFFKNKRD